MSTELVAEKRTNRLHQISVEIFFKCLKMVSPLFNVGLLLGKSAKENRKRAVSTEVTLIFFKSSPPRSRPKFVGSFLIITFSMKFAWRLFIIDLART